MLERPYFLEYRLSAKELEKLGELSLTWSHIEHLLGNCLWSLLRLNKNEATIVVFPMTLERRLQCLSELAKKASLDAAATKALAELNDIMKAIQAVRNNVIHAILAPDPNGDAIFHLRSKERNLTKAQVFETEELTNYAAHAAVALRYALGVPGNPDERWPLPERPAIPEFLRGSIPTRKTKGRQRRSRPQSSRP